MTDRSQIPHNTSALVPVSRYLPMACMSSHLHLARHYLLQITVQWIHVLSYLPRNFLTQFPCPSVRNIRSVKRTTGANCRESTAPVSHLSRRTKCCCALLHQTEALTQPVKGATTVLTVCAWRLATWVIQHATDRLPVGSLTMPGEWRFDSW
jgi:hypothetical protein